MIKENNPKTPSELELRRLGDEWWDITPTQENLINTNPGEISDEVLDGSRLSIEVKVKIIKKKDK